MRVSRMLCLGLALGALVVAGVGLPGVRGQMGGVAGSAANPPTVRIVEGGAAGGSADGAATAAVRQKTVQMRGFTMRLVENTPAGVQGYKDAIDELADMGCTWINFSYATYQENVTSEAIASPGKFSAIPSNKDTLEIMKEAKKRGMGVMMMPVVLLNNSGSKDWRGVINPPNWNNWFASYTDFIVNAAKLAQEGDVDIFCVGSELLSTETEALHDRWVSVIKRIRAVYKGKLTYSANWDHYESVTFWDQLDYVGMNNYYELSSKPGVQVPELVKAWEPIKKNILEFAAKQKKPFMFTEVGWHNLSCTLSQPWNYVAEGPIDLDEQMHAFQSFVEAWKKVPNEQFMGAFIWEWYPGGAVTQEKPMARGTYSLQGTKALDVVKEWFKMP